MPSGVMELGVTVGGSQDWVLNPFSFLLLSISSTEKKTRSVPPYTLKLARYASLILNWQG